MTPFTSDHPGLPDSHLHDASPSVGHTKQLPSHNSSSVSRGSKAKTFHARILNVGEDANENSIRNLPKSDYLFRPFQHDEGTKEESAWHRSLGSPQFPVVSGPSPRPSPFGSRQHWPSPRPRSHRMESYHEDLSLPDFSAISPPRPLPFESRPHWASAMPRNHSMHYYYHADLLLPDHSAKAIHQQGHAIRHREPIKRVKTNVFGGYRTLPDASEKVGFLPNASFLKSKIRPCTSTKGNFCEREGKPLAERNKNGEGRERVAPCTPHLLNYIGRGVPSQSLLEANINFESRTPAQPAPVTKLSKPHAYRDISFKNEARKKMECMQTFEHT
jgi:hypothetical protein